MKASRNLAPPLLLGIFMWGSVFAIQDDRTRDVEPTDGLKAWVTSVGALRPYEMLLSAGFPHRRFEDRELEVFRLSDLSDPRVRRRLEAEDQIQSEFDDEVSAATLWAKGVLELCRGRPVEAVDLLEKASGLSPWSSRIANDLAVAYKARADLSARTPDLVLAMIAVHRSLESNPDLVAARFNRVLLLAEFGLFESAARGWRDLGPTGTPPLDAEIQDRRKQAAARLAGPVWDADEVLRLARDGSGDDLMAAVRRHPLQVRDAFALKWAAEEDLQTLGKIAAAHGEVTGDPDLQDTVSALEKNPDQREFTLRAMSKYAEARRAYNVQQRDQAQALLREAIPVLEKAGSPLAYWGGYQYAVGVYSKPDYPESARLLSELMVAIRDLGYTGLEGKVLWMVGLNHFRDGEFHQALETYREALARFEKVQENENIAAVHNLIAEILDRIGQPEPAWENRITALRQLDPDVGARRRQQIRRLAGERMLAVAGPEAALPFFDESVAAGLGTGNPLLVAIGYWSRSRLHTQQGSWKSAESDIAAAREWKARIPDPGIELGVSIDIARVEGERWLAQDPSRAVEPFTLALERSRRRGNVYPQINILRGRAAAYLKTGNRTAAEADVAEGIRLADQREAELKDTRQATAFLSSSRPLFEQAVQLRIADEDTKGALEYVARSRILPRMLGRVTGAPRVGVAEIPSALPADVVVLDYFGVEESLFLWVITAEGIELIPLEVTRTRISQDIGAYIASAPTASAQVRRELSTGLHEALLAPARAFLEGKRRLVVIPDGALRDLPFSNLNDSRRQRHLFEDLEVVISPGLNGVRVQPSSSAPAWEDSSLVAFGDPALAEEFQKTLPGLPFARREIEEIAAVFPGESRIFAGREATEERFKKESQTGNLVHLAAHSGASGGFLDEPGLLLAPNGGDTDGRIRSEDLAAGNFPKVRLVVLSGCRTAMGLATGQTFGLAGNFLTAGVPAVVASYWEVEDEGTMELMMVFYRELAKGQPPAAALRAAKVRSLEGDSSAWAAFEVIVR